MSLLQLSSSSSSDSSSDEDEDMDDYGGEHDEEYQMLQKNLDNIKEDLEINDTSNSIYYKLFQQTYIGVLSDFFWHWTQTIINCVVENMLKFC